MSSKIKRRLPTQSGKPVPALLTNEVEEFGRRLYNALLDRGMSQSDLARKVYNETTTDARGYEVVVGKDRISSYVRGKTRPEPKTLKKIAEALGMTPEELAPDLAASAVEQSNPSFQLTVVAGHENMCLLKINQLVPMGIAMEIGAILAKLEKK